MWPTSRAKCLPYPQQRQQQGLMAYPTRPHSTVKRQLCSACGTVDAAGVGVSVDAVGPPGVRQNGVRFLSYDNRKNYDYNRITLPNYRTIDAAGVSLSATPPRQVNIICGKDMSLPFLVVPAE